MTGAEHSLQLKRLIPAPRERVFQAWIDPDKLQKWWGPGDVACVGAEVDPRVGGNYKITMKSVEGAVFSVSGEYREVTAPERLVFTWDWEDEAMSVGETLVTVKFADQDGKTEIELTHEKLPAAEVRDEHKGGWTHLLEKLESAA